MSPSYPTDAKGRYVRIPIPLKRETKAKPEGQEIGVWSWMKEALVRIQSNLIKS